MAQNTIHKSKLIIHETDSHGKGYICYNGKTEYYCYDLNCDMREAIEVLKKIGFLNEKEIKVYEEDEIYLPLMFALDNGLIK